MTDHRPQGGATDRLDAELRGAAAALVRAESAQPTEALWADLSDRGGRLAMQTKQQRIVAIAAAAVLAVVMFGAGLAIGGRRDPAPGVIVGGPNGTTVGTAGSGSSIIPPSPYLAEHRATLGLAGALEREGLLSLATMVDPTLVAAADLASARGETDAALAAYRAATGPADRPELIDARKRLDDRLRSLEVNRRSVDDLQTDGQSAVDQFEQTASMAVDVSRARLRDEGEINSAFYLLGLAALAESQLSGMREAALLLLIATSPGQPQPGSREAQRFGDLVSTRLNRDADLELFNRYAAVDDKQTLRNVFANDAFLDVETQALGSPGVAPISGDNVYTTMPAPTAIVDSSRWLLDAYSNAIMAVFGRLATGTSPTTATAQVGSAPG